jgi:HK97 gp10 family phage protein
VRLELGIEGDQEVMRRLKMLMSDDASRIIRRGLKAAAEVVRAAVQEEAPVDSGTLRDSIIVKMKTYDKTTHVAIIGANYAKAPHAHLVEFGTAPRVTKKGKFSGAMPANAFQRRAFERTKGKVQQILADEVRKGIAQELGR